MIFGEIIYENCPTLHGEHMTDDGLPGVNVHQQHQRLHCDHVDAFTVKSCNF